MPITDPAAGDDYPCDYSITGSIHNIIAHVTKVHYEKHKGTVDQAKANYES